MLTYEEFKEEIKNRILDFLPNVTEGTVDIKEITKGNDVKLDGLIIMRPDTNISPTIYLNDIYKEYEAGADLPFPTMTIDNCMHKIAVLYNESIPKENFNVDLLKDFEIIKNKLTFIICRADENKEALKDCVTRIKGDFALIPKILVSNIMGEQAQGTIKVTNQISEMWGKSNDEIIDQAISNASLKHPAKFSNMVDVLAEMMEMSKEELAEMMGNEPMPMHVLTNESNLNGAATLFYPDLLNDIRKQLRAELIIIPSSIHETIILPYNDTMSERDISSMIQEVNATQVRPEEVLSDRAYMYQSATREIVPMETFLQEEQTIIEDIQKSGFKATRNLIVAMKEVNAAVGCTKSLKEIASMIKEKNADETLEDKLNQVADICKSQEKARTQDEPSL